MTTTQPGGTHAMKKSWSRGSEESPRFYSPMRWDGTEPENSPENSPGKLVDNSMAVVTVDKLKHISPEKIPQQQKPPELAATKVLSAGGVGDRRSRTATVRSRTEEVVRKASLGFRLCEVAVCLISFSVMAADKTQGWSGDSYDRYKEYRYCLAMNVIGFAYSGLQACDLAFQLVTGKHIIAHHLRYHFDFFMDQVVAYLLISASSSAATRVDDWQSNWGRDEFTELATVSIGMSFLAFAAFAMSSLISGYILCNRSSM